MKNLQLLENRSKLFVDTIKLICRLTKIRVPIVRPRRLKIYTAWCVYNRASSNYIISYNPNNLLMWTHKEIIEIAAHELGHIKYPRWDRTKAEYTAQLFALKTIHKHLPKLFNLKLTKFEIRRNKKWYGKAFKQALGDFKRWKK